MRIVDGFGTAATIGGLLAVVAIATVAVAWLGHLFL